MAHEIRSSDRFGEVRANGQRAWHGLGVEIPEGIDTVAAFPSGDPVPSGEDKQVTERLKSVGELVGIELLDHVVMGRERFYSFADESFKAVPR